MHWTRQLGDDVGLPNDRNVALHRARLPEWSVLKDSPFVTVTQRRPCTPLLAWFGSFFETAMLKSPENNKLLRFFFLAFEEGRWWQCFSLGVLGETDNFHGA